MSGKYRKNIIGNISVYIICIILILGILFPLYWMINSSFISNDKVFSKPVKYFAGKDFSLKNYIYVFTTGNFPRYALNSLITSFFTALFSIFICLLAAFAFSRIKFPFKNFLLLLMLATMIMPQIATIIPLFRLLKDTKLMNSLYLLIILYTSNVAPFTIWAFLSFLKQIPKDIEESATIDGANFIIILTKIIIPLMKPALYTFFIINFVSAWGELLYATVFASTTKLKTLAVGIISLSGSSQWDIPWGNISAWGTLMTIPLILVAVIFQKRILSGLTSGAIKG